ncbi:MAG: acylphosphatase [Myxococcales bacterium]|nr:acylphosphatase [Myxococcales bacterium]
MTEVTTIRRRVLVTGRVQGVCFRASCARAAEAASVGGQVRNLRDGRVEAVFEGSVVAVEKMINWCRIGPRGASVTRVTATDEPVVGEMEFRVVYGDG